jgi:hypothetical protein
MTKLPSNVIEFAAGDVTLFEEFKDYWNQYRSENGSRKYSFSSVDQSGKAITLFEKEAMLNAHLIREISKRSGVDFASMPIEQACTHPLVAWSAGLLVSQLIDAILPDTLIDSIGSYSEVRVLGYGETGVFSINSRDLFPVSRAGRLGMREAEVHKGFQGQVTLNPEYRTMTVGVAMFRVLTGQESLSTFVVKALRSIETAMTKDVYDAFAAAMLALSTTATTGLRVTGYTQQDLVKLAQKVSAFSGGAAPILLGTKVALSQVFPDDANYRYTLDDSQVTLGYIRNISGINTFEIPQVANWESPFATYIADDKLYLVAPGTDKIVKVVLGGAMVSNTNGPFDNATLTQNATMTKAWKTGVVTSSVAGCITL